MKITMPLTLPSKAPFCGRFAVFTSDEAISRIRSLATLNLGFSDFESIASSLHSQDVPQSSPLSTSTETGHEGSHAGENCVDHCVSKKVRDKIVKNCKGHVPFCDIVLVLSTIIAVN